MHILIFDDNTENPTSVVHIKLNFILFNSITLDMVKKLSQYILGIYVKNMHHGRRSPHHVEFT